MGAARSARILAAGATWRLTGIAAAGDALLTAVTTGSETDRTLAGMLLVKAGNRSVPVVTDAVLTGKGVDDLVDVLASINTADARAALERVAQAPPSTVAAQTKDAAAAALRTLDQIRRQDDAGS
jgi:hypothetical protein